MTGILYARYQNAWVPILANALPAGGLPGYQLTLDTNGNAVWMPSTTTPAYAGPRRDIAPDQAQFGHVNDVNTVRGLCLPGDGDVYLTIGGANNIHLLYESGGGNETVFGSLSQVRSSLSRIGLGDHPQHGGYHGLWSVPQQQSVNGADYMVISDGSGLTLFNGWTRFEGRVTNQTFLWATSSQHAGFAGLTFSSSSWRVGWFNIGAADWAISIHPSNAETHLNANGLIGFSIGNVSYGNVSGSGIYTARKFSTDWAPSNSDWTTAQVLVQQYGSTAQLALHVPGVVAQLAHHSGTPGALKCVDTGGQYAIPIYASSYPGASTIRIKRDVRPLHDDLDRPVVPVEPLSDTVDGIDIMALRPVIYRPSKPLQRIVANDGETYTDDPDTFHYEDWPADTVAGRMSRRERIGLIAEEVQHVLPCAVHHEEDGAPFAIEYDQVTIALLDHVQQLTRTVETLQYRIAELEAERG